MGVAASALHHLPLIAQSPARKIGYCIIGLGRIADHHMRGIAESSTARVTGLVSGHRDKAERIAAQYGVSTSSIYSYENIERIRENKDIDAVIVCLPNSMHAEYTIRSAKSGKHVLCEKPMAISVAECEQMISACKLANVKLMIAYRLHYEPITLKTIKLIRDGAIGKVEAIDSANGFNIAPNEWRSTRALGGGGPLMDVGIYSLNATRYLTGEDPIAFTAVATTPDQDSRFQGVEENLAWTMKFPSGAVASCITTYGASMPGYYKVFGSKGWLEVDEFGYQGLHLTANYRSDRNTPPTRIDEKNPEPDPKQFARQIDHFSRCILENRTPDTPGEEGLKDMQHIQSIYKAAGLTLG
ncbi:Gfo/Idh/MocA family protein [Edaphobacter albus]|uniref:Gfo/Idh/MocA family protein n=1 Tax=Edaphobacter sp. 4G125 TaxID=2763071 RepID=UPI0016451CF9|nr:Gfo/Idh/MocA family oxidoreductase [Edaphobacter sp. 4G125]QNI38200.1 Gfo/Idh/MocA family oxidoreductase [Edaphobacter sp. 4G125]